MDAFKDRDIGTMVGVVLLDEEKNPPKKQPLDEKEQLMLDKLTQALSEFFTGGEIASFMIVGKYKGSREIEGVGMSASTFCMLNGSNASTIASLAAAAGEHFEIEMAMQLALLMNDQQKSGPEKKGIMGFLKDLIK